MQRNARWLPLAALLILLVGCSTRAPEAPPAAAPQPDPPPAVTQSPAPEPEPDAAQKDGLEGRYYNDYLRMTLTLDGCGGCTLRSADTDAAGAYAVFPGGLTLDFGTRQETAYEAENGDLTIEGRSGWFLRDWDYWGISAEETAISDTAAARSAETLMNPDGSYRYRDYARQLACTCTAELSVLPDLPTDALAITDGGGAFVTGRNVTDALAAFSGTAEDFLASYIEHELPADFALLYGDFRDSSELRLSAGTLDGRLAEADLLARSGTQEIAVSVILYTSSYSDGTANYICKCCFAPAEDGGRAAALRDAVSEMSAVRWKAEY